MPKNAVLYYYKPPTDSTNLSRDKHKLGKGNKKRATSTEHNLPDGATHMSPPSSVLPVGPVKKRAKTRKVKSGDTLGKQKAK